MKSKKLKHCIVDLENIVRRFEREKAWEESGNPERCRCVEAMFTQLRKRLPIEEL